MRIIPDYLRKAAAAYRDSGKSLCTETIQLALSIELYSRELEQGKHGGVPPGEVAKKIVRSRLKQLTGDESFVSRALAIGAMAKAIAGENLKLDEVRSQGVLYAMIPCWSNALQENQLAELIEDAGKLSISKFRRKWNKQPVRAKSPQKSPTVENVLTWLKTNAAASEVDQVYSVAAEILEQHATL